MSYEEDFPPVETVPFDPFLGDIAIRVRCPELNLRNTFITQAVTLRCSTRMRVPANSFDFTKTNKRVVIPQGVFDTSMTKRSCNSKKLSILNLNARFNRARFNCRTFPIASQLPATKKGPCTIKSADNIVSAFYQNCRINGKQFPIVEYIARRTCPKTAKSIPDLVSASGFRRFCGTYPMDMKISRYLCRARVYTLGNFTPVTAATSNSSWSCRVTEALLVTGYTFKKVCNNYRLGASLPVTFGASSNEKRLCKVVDFENSDLGQAVCHAAGLMLPVALSYTSMNVGLCRIYPITEAVSKRWRCGTLLLAELDFIPYGRVWGSTFNLPQYYQDFINNRFVRQTGRMTGKIRN